MSNRDGLLDNWSDQHRRLATAEASLVLAIDLLMECIDVLDPDQHPLLHPAVRTFLLNVPVGGR